jgi:hypothetical protein
MTIFNSRLLDCDREHPTTSSNPILPPHPLGNINDEGKTKYKGEKWLESSFAGTIFS